MPITVGIRRIAVIDEPVEATYFRRTLASVHEFGRVAVNLEFFMPDQPPPEVELLRAAYAAFNARDINAALATMSPDVAWPRAFKGGVVRGHQDVKAYWTEQWSEIDPHVEPVSFHSEDNGRVLVEVHQVVRDLDGAILGDEHVAHRFTLEDGLIQAMEVSPMPPSSSRGVLPDSA